VEEGIRMCGIFVTSKDYVQESVINPLLTNRGPDATHSLVRGGITFLHTLLSMTGETTKQPITDEDVVCVFNGEVYNYRELGEFPSDSHAIISAYKSDNERFTQILDGEYAIVLADFSKSEIYFCTDIFGIKPLYYSIEGDDFSFSSYPELLKKVGHNKVSKCLPNKVYKFSIDKCEIDFIDSNHVFDLEQIDGSYDDWHEAFLNAIKKRFTNIRHDIILPLSSGHDSGGIHCALGLLEIPHTTYTFFGREHTDILTSRGKVKSSIKKYIKHSLTNEEKQLCFNFLYSNASRFLYGQDLDFNKMSHDGFQDPGALGLTYLLAQVKKENPNIRILASGQGADEVMTTIQGYGFGEMFNPLFFPEDLTSVFPWNNFYFGSQSSYLSKEECVTGAFGIEGRYPYLDKQVVQKFLSLKSELKNEQFKSPLSDFMKQNDYPFSEGENPKVFKRGFNA
jgi:asparagine synthetase B (glutamine-hydrolysing)